MLSGNKGEWTEAYVFLKLLGDGKLYAADKNLQPVADVYYPILKIVRHESGSSRHYCLDANVNIVDGETNVKLKQVPIHEFLTRSIELLEVIKHAAGSFSVPSIESFLRSVDVTSLAAVSVDKADIKITVHDLHTGKNPDLGFSIKSMLGKDSTLFNAGAATNFIYEVVGDGILSLDIDSINKINEKPKIARRIDALKTAGFRLEFRRVESATLHSNLRLIDGDLPMILANLLQLKYSCLAPLDLSELVQQLALNNPADFDLSQGHPMYEHKIKSFLTDSALGMTPSTMWRGQYSATGGMIIVKQDGAIVCYHIYNRAEFQEYLFENTRLEQASTTRYGFGFLYREGEKVLLKLNLQVRFK